MEFRHEADIRYHVDDVIRSFPIGPSRTTLEDPAADVAGPDTPVRAETVPDPDPAEAQPGRTLVGYPVVFDTWTEINSWEGRFLERLSPTSANKTLADRSDRIQLMFNHGFDFMLEQTPIGRYRSFDPDEHGVYAEAALVDRGIYPKVDLVAELIRTGAIYGQSFRFQVIEESWNDEPDPSDHNSKGLPERTIEQFRWIESGPVTYPAYEATSVALRDDGQPFAVRSTNEWHLWCESRGYNPTAHAPAVPHSPPPNLVQARARLAMATHQISGTIGS